MRKRVEGWRGKEKKKEKIVGFDFLNLIWSHQSDDRLGSERRKRWGLWSLPQVFHHEMASKSVPSPEAQKGMTDTPWTFKTPT
jgi:hypothetical protein